MGGERSATATRRGRPARYLLGGIAVCGVCGSATRVGTQNVGVRRPSTGRHEEPSRYRVYECAGSAGTTGFHVSMRQEFLDQIVRDAVLARVSAHDFEAPRTRKENEDGSERRALQLEIKSHRIWLDAVHEEGERRGQLWVVAREERIVLPKIEAAQRKIDALEELDPLPQQLKLSRSALGTWDGMSLTQQRHIIQSLVTARINPVPADERGQRGLNSDRVALIWERRADSAHATPNDRQRPLPTSLWTLNA